MYKCECGETFTDPQKFNAHKRHCKIHLSHYGKVYINRLHDQDVIDKKLKNIENRKKQKLQQWVSEQHICEHCGKIMTKKFGSGRFCCQSCANSKVVSQETKNKIGSSMKKHSHNNGALARKQQAISQYNLHPKFCNCCGKKLPYELRKRHTCSKECHSKILHDTALKTVSTQHNNKKQYKFGTYKGIACDSSWELAYVVYCLEHGIAVKRNNKGFTYVYEGREHKYYPDFIINGNYIEIKNYWTPCVQAKIDFFPKDLQYKIYYKKDINHCIEYCISKYGKNFSEILYE